MTLLKKTLALLSPAERRRASLLLGMILVMALLDVVGVASIMPFMAVLANPAQVQANPWLAAAYGGLGFTQPESFLFFLGLVVFAALVLSIGFKALTTWALLHFTQMRSYSLGRRLVADYLHQPYEWFLDRHSADLGKTVLSEVQLVISSALLPLMQALAQGAVALALLALLIAADPPLALAVSLALGLGDGGIYALLRRRLARLGRERVAANRSRFQILTEAFGGIKEVKIAGLEATLIDRFDGPAHRFARTQVFVRCP